MGVHSAGGLSLRLPCSVHSPGAHSACEVWTLPLACSAQGGEHRKQGGFCFEMCEHRAAHGAMSSSPSPWRRPLPGRDLGVPPSPSLSPDLAEHLKPAPPRRVGSNVILVISGASGSPGNFQRRVVEASLGCHKHEKEPPRHREVHWQVSGAHQGPGAPLIFVKLHPTGSAFSHLGFVLRLVFSLYGVR